MLRVFTNSDRGDSEIIGWMMIAFLIVLMAVVVIYTPEYLAWLDSVFE